MKYLILLALPFCSFTCYKNDTYCSTCIVVSTRNDFGTFCGEQDDCWAWIDEQKTKAAHQGLTLQCSLNKK